MLCKLVKTVDKLSDHISNFESEIINQIAELVDRINNLDPAGESNAVLYTAQTLTDAQKAQARANIGANGVYIFEISGITPNGGRVAVDATKYAELSSAIADGQAVIAKINPDSFPSYQTFKLPIYLPLTVNEGASGYIFTGLISPTPPSLSSAYDIYRTWIGVFDVVASSAGFSVVKITDVTEPAPVTDSITSTSDTVPLSGTWEMVATSDSSAGDINFLNKAGLIVVNVNAPTTRGKIHIAKAVDGVVNSFKQTTLYLPGSASDGDNAITGFKWSGTGTLNYTLKR